MPPLPPPTLLREDRKRGLSTTSTTRSRWRANKPSRMYNDGPPPTPPLPPSVRIDVVAVSEVENSFRGQFRRWRYFSFSSVGRFLLLRILRSRDRESKSKRDQTFFLFGYDSLDRGVQEVLPKIIRPTMRLTETASPIDHFSLLFVRGGIGPART